MSVGGARDVHMLRTRRIGGYASADVHVQVEPRLSVSEGHMIALLVENRLKQEIDEIDDVTVHIDPEDDETVPACADLPPRARGPASPRQHSGRRWPGPNIGSSWCCIISAGESTSTSIFPLAEFPDPAAGRTVARALAQALVGSRGVRYLEGVFFAVNHFGAIYA